MMLYLYINKYTYMGGNHTNLLGIFKYSRSMQTVQVNATEFAENL